MKFPFFKFWGLRLFTFFVGLILTSFVQAETCRENHIQSVIKKSAAEGKVLTLAEYEARKKSAPNMGYVEEVGVSTCEMKSIKAVLLGSDYASLCSGIKTPYRLRCLREWIGHHKVTNSTEVTLLMTLIPPAGVEDRKLPHVNTQMVVAQLIDTVLFTFERLDTANFYVRRMTAEHPEMKTEIENLQKLEIEMANTIRDRLIKTLDEKIKILRDQSGREPAGDLNVRHWIKSMIPKMETRLENLKNKKF